MKRIGYIYEKIYSLENIKLAIRNASKGKRRRKYVQRILNNADFYAEQISASLRENTYRLSPNRLKTIKEGAKQKERNITVPAFYPDQIIQLKYYVRYVDDMVLMDDNKRKLKKALFKLSEYLTKEKFDVIIKENWQLWKTNSRPLDFVGYRFYPKYTRLRKSVFYHLMRTVARIGKHGLNIPRARRFNSLIGYCKPINFKRYYLSAIKPVVSKRAAKKYISDYDKKRYA